MSRTQPNAGSAKPVFTGREISHSEAVDIARRLVNSHFGQEPGAIASIPAHPDYDDDLLIGAYIRQQIMRSDEIAYLKARIAELEANERAYEEIIGKMTYREVAGRIKELEGALRLAEDVLSRAPFSTGIWPNGMHPNAGIEKIRDALEPKHD